ncbi:MAG TPA: AMP-binding protein, partial [Actinomycetales bacterium]
MVEVSIPLLVPLATSGNLSSLVIRQAEQRPDRALFSRPGPDGWTDVTAAQFRADVEGVARGLIAAGVQVGDRVGLMSKTRYEWTMVDFAIWTAGAVTVPIYETSSSEQVGWILGNSGAVACVVETTAHARSVGSVRDDVPTLVDVWQIEGGGLDDLIAAGTEVSDDELTARRTAAGPDDLATIIYTSGTTGRPKGCELTHQNFMALSDNAVAHLSEVVTVDDAATLLFLPLAHIFARLIQVLSFTAGAKVGHSPDTKNLLADFGSFQPTFLLSVPRVFEKIYNSSEQKAAGAGGAKTRIFAMASDTAVAYSKAQESGSPSIALRAQHALFDRLVYAKIRAAMGGRIRYNVSGGAPLGERLGHFYRGAGITVLEGYGLTETTAPST